MKAITIKQPWASLICEGIKDIENRTWYTKFRGRVLIHSSAEYDKRHRAMDQLFTTEQWKYMYEKKGNFLLNRCLFLSFPLSSIIGSVEIVDCVPNSLSVWAEKSKWVDPGHLNIKNDRPIWNWVLANPILFDNPIENIKGKLSFWDYDTIICNTCNQPLKPSCCE